MPEKDEIGWLVEVQSGQALWLTSEHGLWTWTTDSSEAMRFARKRDAEDMIGYYRL